MAGDWGAFGHHGRHQPSWTEHGCLSLQGVVGWTVWPSDNRLEGTAWPLLPPTLTPFPCGAWGPVGWALRDLGRPGPGTASSVRPADFTASPTGTPLNDTSCSLCFTARVGPGVHVSSGSPPGVLTQVRLCLHRGKRCGQCLQNGHVDTKQALGGLSEPGKEKGQVRWQRGGLAVGQGPAESLSARSPRLSSRKGQLHLVSARCPGQPRTEAETEREDGQTDRQRGAVGRGLRA